MDASVRAVDEDGSWTIERLRSRVELWHTLDYNWDVLVDPLKSLVKAAVLIPLVIDNGSLFVWLTKRSQAVRNDKGHVSFPGGMRDAIDANAVETALREAEEEIGLNRSDVIILGQLPPWVNLRRTLITPVIGLVDTRFVPAPNVEVAFAFRPPLLWFLSDRDHSSEHLMTSSASLLHSFRYVLPNTVISNDGETHSDARTFGITAHMCVTLACAIYGRPPEFPYRHSELGVNGGRLSVDNPFESAVALLVEIGSLEATRATNSRAQPQTMFSSSKL